MAGIDAKWSCSTLMRGSSFLQEQLKSQKTINYSELLGAPCQQCIMLIETLNALNVSLKAAQQRILALKQQRLEAAPMTPTPKPSVASPVQAQLNRGVSSVSLDTAADSVEKRLRGKQAEPPNTQDGLNGWSLQTLQDRKDFENAEKELTEAFQEACGDAVLVWSWQAPEEEPTPKSKKARQSQARYCITPGRR